MIDGGKVIAVLGKGEMFGEMALLSPEKRSATVVAEESSSFFVLTQSAFHPMSYFRIKHWLRWQPISRTPWNVFWIYMASVPLSAKDTGAHSFR